MSDHDPTPSRPGPASPPWAAVFRCVGVEAALAEIARWLGPDGGLELAAGPEPFTPSGARVPGNPVWRVRASRGGVDDAALAARAAEILEA
jgi:hypothetical protein